MKTKIFENKKQIQNLVERADDNGTTKRLVSLFRKLKKSRVDFYLQLEDLEQILKWKLRGQFGRQLKRRQENTNKNIIAITKAAFEIRHTDNDIETKIKLKLLCTLSGVEIPIASAILTLCFPTQYSVIDFRNWRQVYKTEKQKTNYTTKEYIEYLKTIKSWAKDFGVTPQEIDLAIWQEDIDDQK